MKKMHKKKLTKEKKRDATEILHLKGIRCNELRVSRTKKVQNEAAR